MDGFAAEAGLAESLPADDANGYTLEIDGMAVSFREASEGLELLTTAEVGDLPDEGAEQVYRLLMEAMFRDGRSGGTIFSLEPGTKRIWAHRRDFLVKMDCEGFQAMLGQFIDGLEEWKRLVSGLFDLAPKLAQAAEAEKDSASMMGSDLFLRV